MRAPCKDCTDRAVGCHGQCTKYATYRADCESRYQLRKDLALLGSYVAESQKRQKRLKHTGKLP